MDTETNRRQFLGVAGCLAGSLLVPAMASASRRSVELAGEKRSELIELMSALVGIRSLSGESAADAQRVVEQYLARLPYRVERSEDRPSQYEHHAEFMPPNPPGDGPFVNLLGWPTRGPGPRAAMFAHIDTHSIDEGWETDPFAPLLIGKRMYGLGVADDKGGIAAMLVAASIVAERGGPLPLLMSLHGKGGGSRGSLPIFDRLATQGHAIESVIYVHPAETGRGLDDIKHAVQGVLDLELTVTGWRSPPMEIGSMDSADWSTGGNALDECLKLIDHLRAGAFRDVAFNLGAMTGGDRFGSVAEAAVARFRLKFSGTDTWNALLERGRQAIDRYAGELQDVDSRWGFDLKPAGYRTNPGASDWNAPASQVLRASIEAVKGRAPDPYPNHYAGDIRYPIRLLGVPAYGIGSVAGNFYGPNEWVDVDDLVNLVAVLVQTLEGWGGA